MCIYISHLRYISDKCVCILLDEHIWCGCSTFQQYHKLNCSLDKNMESHLIVLCVQHLYELSDQLDWKTIYGNFWLCMEQRDLQNDGLCDLWSGTWNKILENKNHRNSGLFLSELDRCASSRHLLELRFITFF